MNRNLFNNMLSMCRTYYNKYGYFPTVKEIGKELDIYSKSTIVSYLKKLQIAGFIETDHPESPRAYRFKDAISTYGVRRYKKPTEKEIQERIENQLLFNSNSEKKDELNKSLEGICSYSEHEILVNLFKKSTDNERCEFLKNLEYYGNPDVLKIFDEIESM